jgi:hypothetical protein
MYFTREPLTETVITPKEGYKLAVRNARGKEGEEYLVDALEVVSFGPALFFRSLEKPKCFLLPIADYEVVEVREAKLLLKAAPLEKNVTLASKKDTPKKEAREGKEVREERETLEEKEDEGFVESSTLSESKNELKSEKPDRKKERRQRRRRKEKEDENTSDAESGEQSRALSPVIDDLGESYEERTEAVSLNLIPPPSTLLFEHMPKKEEVLEETVPYQFNFDTHYEVDPYLWPSLEETEQETSAE